MPVKRDSPCPNRDGTREHLTIVHPDGVEQCVHCGGIIETEDEP